MKNLKYNLTLVLLLVCYNVIGQQAPVNCDLAIPGCSTPGFMINGTNPPYNIVDFQTGSISNPSSNPQGVNSGCLLTGETVSTFIKAKGHHAKHVSKGELFGQCNYRKLLWNIKV